MWHHRLTNCTNCAARVNPTTGKPSPVTPTARWNKKYYKKFVIKIKLILVLSLLALPGSVAAPAWKQEWRLIIQWRPRLMSKSYFGAKKRRVVFDKKANWQTPEMSYPSWEISEVTLIFRRGMRKPLATFFSLWGRSHRSLSNISLTTKTSPRWETFSRENWENK